MTQQKPHNLKVPVFIAALMALIAHSSLAAGPCKHFTAERQPFFGDLHIHTRYSFDAFLSNQKNDPDGAYRYAKGEMITLPDPFGDQTIKAKIDRAIDFAAVTDHGQFLGEVALCDSDWGTLAWWAPTCIMSRTKNLWVQLYAASQWTLSGGMDGVAPQRSLICDLGDCTAAATTIWADIQAAAERHNDPSDNCEFSAFVGYEYTQGQEAANLHRNVIFRNAKVTERPISVFETDNQVSELWRQLKQQCLDSENGCDVMAIPHNSNLGGGLMFPDPATIDETLNRRALEPLVELIQHKGASECRFDRLQGIGVDTEDELCDFEQIPSDNLHMLGSVEGKMRSEKGQAVNLSSFHRRNMMRNVLKDGLALEQANGLNPFMPGFIGSTDTHTATAGGAQERQYVGHLGSRDAGFRNIQDHFVSNPGGLAVVWAEENRRDALFDAMRRREAYATSGTRPLVRFFAGDYPENLCEDPKAIKLAYDKGVPMGGILTEQPGDMPPRFYISAQRDSGTGLFPSNPLERLQIIKGWVDSNGNTHERVYDVAGSPINELGVDPLTCAATAPGSASLCTVWQDPDPTPDQSAFYYARVLETPSCRWSTLQCQNMGVNPLSDACSDQLAASTRRAKALGASEDAFKNCCRVAEDEAFYTPTIRERAWTSPIWLQPPP
jgi:hypothetical protein